MFKSLMLSPWFTVAKYAVLIAAFFGAGWYVGGAIGYAKGQAEIQKLQQDKIDRQAAQIRQLQADKTKAEKRAAAQHVNDARAFQVMQDKFNSAKAAVDAARAQLAKERNLKNAPDPHMCVLTGTSRVLFDATAAGDVPGSRAAAADSHTGADAKAQAGAEAPCVTVEQIQTGYLNLAEHDAGVTGQLLGLQDWIQTSLIDANKQK